MKRVLITGGSGFVGRKLAKELLARGDQVTVLTRDAKRAKGELPAAVRCAAWNPEKPGPWFEELGIVDAVVHLAGENVAKRWTDAVKKRIESSRIDSRLPRPPRCTFAVSICGTKATPARSKDDQAASGTSRARASARPLVRRRRRGRPADS